MRKIITYLIMVLSCLSCKDDVVPRPPNFVIEAFITADEQVDMIRIKDTSPIDSVNVTSTPIDGAEVSITWSGERFELEFDAATGQYMDPGGTLDVISGEEYNLSVRVGERLATAITTVPPYPEQLTLTDTLLEVPPLSLNFNLADEIRDLFFNQRITLQWDSLPGREFFVVIESRVEEPDPILPEGIPVEAQELLSSFRFISEPSAVPAFDIVGIALDDYGEYVAKVFTVNEEYADLFDNLEQDSRDLNEPPTNIDNAQGIFSAFAGDSLRFEVRRP